MKRIFIFSIGATLGFTVGYFVAKERILRRAEEEIASIKEYTQKKINTYKDEKEKANVAAELIKKVSKEKKEEKLEKLMKRTKEAYKDYTSPYTSDEEEEIDDATPEEEEDDNYKEGMILSKMVEDKSGPTLISEEEFGDLPVLDVETVFYYTENDVFVLEDEQVIEDEDEMFGDAITEFRENDDLEVIYVRNMALTSDYEIRKVHEYFES